MVNARGRNLVIAAVAIVLAGLILVGGYGVWYLFLRPAGPAAVGSTALPVPSAAAATAAATAASSTSPASTSAGQAGGIDGTWKVDTSIGSFSDFSDSFVGYRVQEELASIGGNVAVGRTPDVSGTLTIAGTKVTDVSIEADLTTLQSDDQRRDGQLSRQGIQTGQFPTASFKLTTPIDLGSVPADGQEISVTASGQLTLHGQTRDVQVPLTAKLSGSVIVVTGSLQITFAEYGIDKPNSFAVVSIADRGTMELQLFFTRS
jgi:polyisoprenoid-binding protein YceI